MDQDRKHKNKPKHWCSINMMRQKYTGETTVSSINGAGKTGQWRLTPSFLPRLDGHTLFMVLMIKYYDGNSS